MSEKKSNHNLTIGVEADTTKLTKKLRAIAKHAEALADELELIDAATCKECGSDEVGVKKVRASDGVFTHFHCIWCRHTWND